MCAEEDAIFLSTRHWRGEASRIDSAPVGFKAHKKYPFLPFFSLSLTNRSGRERKTFSSRSPILYLNWETVRDSLEENQPRIGRSPVFS